MESVGIKDSYSDQTEDRYKNGLEIMVKITTMVGLNLSGQISTAFKLSTQFLGMDSAILSNIEGQDYQINHYFGPNDFYKGQKFELDKTLCSVPFTLEHVVAIGNIHESQYDCDPVNEIFSAQSYIGMPFYVNGLKRGTVSFFSAKEKKNGFSQDEIGFVLILSNWIGFIFQKYEFERIVSAEKSALKAEKEKAENANKAKEQFLSTMSHEIRTPLNAILGMTDLMLMEHQEIEQAKRLELLKFSGNNLLALINDILDFNKMEAGKLEIEEIDFELKGLLDKIINLLFPLAEKKGLEFFFKYDEKLPVYVKADPFRLSQVITNLVNNAIKFTKKGSITLQTELIKKTANTSRIKFSIIDTGIGIPSEKVDQIFESFKQASSDTTRKFGGTGLGLAISKRIINLMGSDIQLENNDGDGSLFSFELDVLIGEKVEDEKDPEVVGEIELDHVKVLIAEDNFGNQVLITSLMKKWNIKFDLVENGLDAFNKAKSGGYHLIILDLQMPVMDGYTACRKIRALKDPYFKKVPIMALTASTLTDAKEKTKQAGMDDFITKPLDAPHLRALIYKYATLGVTPEDVTDFDHHFPYIASLVDGDEEAIKDIVSASLESINFAIKKINEGINQTDLKLIRAQLHTLKPNLFNLELGDLISSLEKPEILNDKTKNQLRELVKSIKFELRKNKFLKYTSWIK